MLEGTGPRMAEQDNPQIKDEELYETLREERNSTQKSDRIANAVVRGGRRAVTIRGGEARGYVDWTVPEIKVRAKEFGLTGSSKHRKRELIISLRNS
ncbi:Rho termination factor [Paeniglutamicibacter sp. NPDC012692]|uniref:DUF7218 family protein n=1 Tax=Paeniglutamicibacter sp. NPDC012692 TaxID=3364388 RepID=UPI003696B4DE